MPNSGKSKAGASRSLSRARILNSTKVAHSRLARGHDASEVGADIATQSGERVRNLVTGRIKDGPTGKPIRKKKG